MHYALGTSRSLAAKKSFDCAQKTGTRFALLVAGLVVNQFAVIIAGNGGVLPLFDVFLRHAEVNILLFSNKRSADEFKLTTAVWTGNTIRFPVFGNLKHFAAF